MDRKQVGAWALFDFANSVYPAVVQTAAFSVFYTKIVVGNETGAGDTWWGVAVAISVVIVACSSPLLGAIADRSGVRKRFMLGFTGMCILGVTLYCSASRTRRRRRAGRHRRPERTPCPGRRPW